MDVRRKIKILELLLEESTERREAYEAGDEDGPTPCLCYVLGSFMHKGIIWKGEFDALSYEMRYRDPCINGKSVRWRFVDVARQEFVQKWIDDERGKLREDTKT